MRTIFKIGIVGGLAFGIYKLLGMKRISDKVVTSLSNPRIHTINTRGLVIRSEIIVANPTKSRMDITKPIITLYTNGKYITSSKPENKTITIQPLSETVIESMELVIPWTTLAGYISGVLTKIPQIISAFQAKDMKAVGQTLSIPLEMKYSLYANGLSYESASEKIL